MLRFFKARCTSARSVSASHTAAITRSISSLLFAMPVAHFLRSRRLAYSGESATPAFFALLSRGMCSISTTTRRPKDDIIGSTLIFIPSLHAIFAAAISST